MPRESRKHLVISVVVPVYNMASFIGDCLRSVVDQDYPHVQVIVIDGGSTDGTRDIVEKFKDKLFYRCYEPDGGQTDALNKGFACATGDINCWLNADEEYLPGTLTAVAEEFRRGKDVDLVYGNRVDCDENGVALRTLRRPRMHPKHYTLYCGGVLPTDATFWSARAHRAAGSLDAGAFPRLAMDYDWFLRLSFYVKGWVYLDRSMSLFKHHGKRQTKVEKTEEVRALWLQARRKCLNTKQVSAISLALGWIYWGTLARLQQGNLRTPKGSTLLRLLSAVKR